MRPLSIFLLVVLYIFLLQCSKDYFKEGKEAFSSGDYDVAIDLFSKVGKQKDQIPEYYETVSLAYMYRGEQLYKRSKNVKSLAGNISKAEKFLPEDPSSDFKEKYSDILYALADAYFTAKPKNSKEKELNFNKAFDALEAALTQDSINTAAMDLFNKLEQSHFQVMLDKADQLYRDGDRLDNVDLFFSADYYIKRAARYHPDHKEVRSLQSKIRRKMLPVLNYRDGVSLAVTNYMKERNHFTLNVAVENYLKKPVSIKRANFVVYDYNGRSYRLDEKEMKLKEFLGQKCLKDIRLDYSKPYTDGVVVFSVPKKVRISHLSYESGDKEISRKYFQ